jgi:hypothetical protein
MRRTILAIVMSIVFLCLSTTLVLADSCDDIGVESTIVLNIAESFTYSGSTYEVELIAVNTDENKATLNIDGATYVFEEDVIETLPNFKLATIENIFASTKESTPDSVNFQICKELSYECGTATETGIALNIEKDLVYKATTYTLELIAVNIDENKATIEVDGTAAIFQEGVETTLSDGRVATIWNIFASTKESTPDSVWIQIGDSTFLDCDECENSGELTIVLNQLKKVIYSGTTYALELIAVNTDEDKVTVNINGSTYTLQEDVMTILSTGINATVENIFASTKESTPDTAKFRFCDGDTAGVKPGVVEQEQEQESEQEQEVSCASGCPNGLVCSESLNKCVRPATQFDSFKIVSTVTKLETYSIVLTEIKDDFNRIRAYWISVDNTDKVEKWDDVIDQTDFIIDKIASLKEHLYNNRENLTEYVMENARNFLSEVIDEMDTLAVLVLEASV